MNDFKDSVLLHALRKKWPQLIDFKSLSFHNHGARAYCFFVFDMGDSLFYKSELMDTGEFLPNNTWLESRINEALNDFINISNSQYANFDFLVDLYSAKYRFDNLDIAAYNDFSFSCRVDRIIRELPITGAEGLIALCNANTTPFTIEETHLCRNNASDPSKNPNLRDEALPWDI